ncbi:MAG: DUF935 family protein [Methylococcaceae bacterium]|nr:DUF935 family protein [Methylococcaceae bacterium]
MSYGGEWETVPADVKASLSADATAPADSSGDAVASFAEGAPTPDSVDKFAARLGTQADPLIGKWLDPMRKLLAESADLAEVEGKLAGLYEDMDARDLGELLAQAFAAAELAGRYELKNNIGLNDGRG